MTSPIDIVGTGVFSPKLRQASLVRKQVGQYSSGYLGLEIRTGKGTIDPTDITLRIFRKADFDTYNQTDSMGELAIVVDPAEIQRESEGRYFYEMGPALTGTRANLTALWTYQIGEDVFTYLDHLTVLEQMPTFDGLRDYEKMVIEQVSWMFGDLFDSTEGGANLTENFQTHFTYERIAQLMGIAVARMNIQGVPTTRWTVGEGVGSGMPESARGLLLMGTYIEVLKHFIRSYVEQPDMKNASAVAYTDRRDYMQRWQSVLADEKSEFASALKFVKRKFLTLGAGALLVQGGIYGGGANGLFQSGMYAAQVRSYRFFPAAGAIGIVNGLNNTGGPWQGAGPLS